MTEGSKTLSVRLKQCGVIEFLTAENVPPVDIHRQIKVVYGNDCVHVSTVRQWVRNTKDDCKTNSITGDQ